MAVKGLLLALNLAVAPAFGFTLAQPRALSRRAALVRASLGDDALVPATIIGANGRIGDLLASLGGGRDILVGRGEAAPTDGSGPIYVCTRNDVLGSIVDACPAQRREDIVFMQNGFLDSFLEEKGLADNTQALIFFAVAKKGEAPTDGKTDLNPEGLTKVTGKWADAYAARVRAAGLACEAVGAEEYQVAMFEKLIWIDAFMLVGALHGGITVGEVESNYRDEVAALIEELAGAVAGAKGVAFKPHLADRLCAYARSVAHFPTAIKEFEWRNGFFWNLSEAAEESGETDPCPTHTQYCNQGLVEDLFSF